MTKGIVRPTWPTTDSVVVGGWRFTQHALERCREMAVDLAAVLRVLREPARSYPGCSKYGPGRRVAARWPLAVVYSPDQGAVITVLWDGACGREAATPTNRQTVTGVV